MRSAGNRPANRAGGAGRRFPAACGGILAVTLMVALIVFYAFAALVMMYAGAG